MKNEIGPIFFGAKKKILITLFEFMRFWDQQTLEAVSKGLSIITQQFREQV